ncbi:MAG: RDD family protein [Candidatus Thermoplasmatota archaeon]
MSRIAEFRSGIRSKGSFVKANPLYRIIAYLVDAVLIRLVFEFIVFLLGISGVIPRSTMANINTYLGYGLAPLRGGGWFLDQALFVSSQEDLMIHLSYSALFLAYFITLESGRLGGQTIGKKIFGIKVVNRSGSDISFKISALRNSTKYLLRVPSLGFLVGIFELITLVFYSTRSGDMLADTEVKSFSNQGIVSWVRAQG